MPRSTRILHVAAALTFVLPATAAQAAGWTPAVPLPGTAGAGAPQVAAAPAGPVTVAWAAGGVVYVADRAQDGTFGAPRTVSAGGVQGDPVLAVGKGGRAVLAWKREGLVEASVRAAAGAAFDAPQAISGANADDLTAAVSGAGTVAVGWVRTSLVQIVERTAAQTSWPAATQTFTENGPSTPRLAATGDGRLTAVWTAMVETKPGFAPEPHQRSATHPAGAAWSAATTGVRVGLDSMDWAPVTAAGDDTGAVTALWASRTGDGSDGYSTGHPVITAGVSLAGGPFGAGTPVSGGPTTEGGHVPAPALAVAGSGDAAAAWLSQAKGEDRATAQIALRAGSAGAWSGPTALETAPIADPLSAPDVAVDPQGRPVVVWERLDGTIAGSRSAGGFTPAMPISGAGADDPQVAVDAGGHGVAVWRRGGALETSTYDTTPGPPHEAHDGDPKPPGPGAGDQRPGGTTPQPQPGPGTGTGGGTPTTTTPRATQRLTALTLTPRTLRAGKAATLTLRLAVPADVHVKIERRKGRRRTTTGTTRKTAKRAGRLTIKLPRTALRTRGSYLLTVTAGTTTARKTFRVK